MTTAELILKMYRTNFSAFIGMAFNVLHTGIVFDRNWHIDIIADKLVGLASGQITRLAINVPPRSLKSFLASISLPAFLLGRNPTYKIILVAGSRQLGKDIIMKLHRLMSSDRYRAVF